MHKGTRLPKALAETWNPKSKSSRGDMKLRMEKLNPIQSESRMALRIAAMMKPKTYCKNENMSDKFNPNRKP